MHLPESIKNGPLGKTLTSLSLTGRPLQGPGCTWNCYTDSVLSGLQWRSGMQLGTHSQCVDAGRLGSMVVTQPFCSSRALELGGGVPERTEEYPLHINS
jgi:hypothetical protein